MSISFTRPCKQPKGVEMNTRSAAVAIAFVMLGAFDISIASTQSTSNANPAIPNTTSTTNPDNTTSGPGQYKPKYLPNEVKLTQTQIDEITQKVSEQYFHYHESLTQQNKAAALGQQLWGQKAEATLADEKWHLEHARSVYRSQSLYSFAIFVMVMLVMLISLALTIHQFVKDSSALDKLADTVRNRIARKKSNGSNTLTTEELTAINKLADAVRSTTNAEFGVTGMKIGTQLVGLAMLAFSMGFFYLYLRHVYPITVAPPSQIEANKAEGK